MNSYFDHSSIDNTLNIVSIIFLLFSSLVLLIVSKELRSTKLLFLIVFTAMAIRIILIIYNVLISPLPGSDKDAIGFIRGARNLIEKNTFPENFVGANLFEFIISIIFRYSIDNILFLVSLNNVIYFLTIIIILKTLAYLKVSEKFKIISVLILLLYPSLLFNSITVLREPLQFLFLTLSVYGYIRLIKRGFSIPVYFLIYLSIFLLGLLHNGLLFLVPILTLILSYGLYKNINDNQTKLLIILTNVLFLSFILSLFLSGLITSPLVDSVLEGKAVDYTENYRERSPDTRASYEASISFGNPIGLVYSTITTTIKYFIYPLPWQMTSLQDLVPLFENIIRLYFIYYIIKNFKLMGNLKLLFYTFIVIEVVWAIGTSNWGTASRHHIIQSQILIILFVFLKNVNLNKNHIRS